MLDVPWRRYQLVVLSFVEARTVLCLSQLLAAASEPCTHWSDALVPVLQPLAAQPAAGHVTAAVRHADEQSLGSDGRTQTWTDTVQTPPPLTVLPQTHIAINQSINQSINMHRGLVLFCLTLHFSRLISGLVAA